MVSTTTILEAQYYFFSKTAIFGLYIQYKLIFLQFSSSFFMSFTGDEGHSIPLSTATEWTATYREANPDAIQSRFFGYKILEQILAQPGCKGIRLYYGTDGSTPQLIAVGADGEENDQIDTNCMIADESMAGPPHCGKANVLNSSNP